MSCTLTASMRLDHNLGIVFEDERQQQQQVFHATIKHN